jgi:tetrapyrrole methylase family protein/MazG family protein
LSAGPRRAWTLVGACRRRIAVLPVVAVTAKPDRETSRPADAFAELVEIVRRLRAPGGCPWDREQTHETLKPFLVEETYELLDAIDRRRDDDMREELGDVLLQIMLHAQIGAEDGAFDVADVVAGLSRKLVGRHPHVFGDAAVSGAGEVLVNWEKIKQTEKADRGLFDGLPASLPALQKAARMGEKAGRVGFDWPDAAGVRAKVGEELREVDEAIASGDAAAVGRELGDLLFSVAQWARHLGHQPEEVLRAGSGRFASRFAAMQGAVRGSGRELCDLDPASLEAAWQEAKRR